MDRCMLCRVCFHRVSLRISGFMSIIVLTAHVLLYPLYPPASCSFTYHALSTVGLYELGLWWHEIKVYRWGFPCLDYSFDVLVSWSRDLKPYNQICSSSALFGCITIHVFTLARHLAFVSPLAWGVSSDSPGSSCPGHGAWSVWILPVADQSGIAVAWISSRSSGALSFQAPLCASRVFLL